MANDPTRVDELQQKILEAMNIIAEKSLNTIAYDKTIVCTIVDNKAKEEGRYVVTDGSVTFNAYSNITNYAVKDSVYVTIPNNDFNMNKIIVGKKTADTEKPFVFVNPFDAIVDLTENLVVTPNGEKPPTGGLLANGEIQYQELYYNDDISSQNEIGFTNFERLGIQAQFQSWTPEAVEGNFGLRVTVYYKTPSTVGETWETGERVVVLDASHMYGNPYNFESFYQQQLVVDITDIDVVTGIKVEFYQLSNFKDKNGNALEAVDFTGRPLNPNLFVKDVYICMGYDLGAIDQEKVDLYTLNSPTYTKKATKAENHKRLQVRWVHVNEDGTTSQYDSETPGDFDVRWYRYTLGAPSADNYSGVYWEYLPIEEHVGLAGLSIQQFNYYPNKDYNAGYIEDYTPPEGITIDNTDLRPYFSGVSEEGWNDQFYNEWFRNPATGKYHRFSFWEKVTLAYRLYWLAPDAFDKCGVPDVFRKGGTVEVYGKNAEEYEKDKNYLDYAYANKSISYDEYMLRLEQARERYINPWFLKFIDKNPYELDYGAVEGEKYKFDWPEITDSQYEAMYSLIYNFADSFGEWESYKDEVTGLKDLRPKDEGAYTILYNAMVKLFSAVDNPTELIKKRFYYEFDPAIDRAFERLKVIIVYEGTAYRSQIIEFLNQENVPNNATIDSLQALNIVCEDGTYGNYRIYGQGNCLLDGAEAKQIRQLTATFDAEGYEETEGSILTEAERITWGFPASGTMLRVDGFDYTDKRPTATGSGITYDAKNDLILITRYGDKSQSDGNDGPIDPYQFYYIERYYSATKANNTIQCEIVKDNIVYRTQKEMTFGLAGTTGTPSTLVLDFDGNKMGVAAATRDEAVTVTARLYDVNNKEVDISNLPIKWSWFKDTGEEGYSFIPVPKGSKFDESKLYYYYDGTKGQYILAQGNISEENIHTYYTREYGHQYEIFLVNYKDEQDRIINNKIQLVGDNIDINNIYILQCTVSGFGDFDLTAYLPVPLYKKTDTLIPWYLTGATEVIYDADGVPNYYRQPYKLHQFNNKGQEISQTVLWNMSYQNNKERQYLPKLAETASHTGKILYPAPVYVPDTGACAVVGSVGGEVVWTQPILIIQNTWPSAMVNEWDGKTLTMDHEEGAMLATKMAVGKKDKDTNEFSGVMIGDWNDGKTTDSMTLTGVYGFNKGAMSYALKEDGTAFFGKSGRGRIEFDGTKGTIFSAFYENGNGMKIDLDNAVIDMRQTGGYAQVENPTPEMIATGEYYQFVTYIHTNVQYPNAEENKNIRFYLPADYSFIGRIESSQFVSNKYYIREEKTNEVVTTDPVSSPKTTTTYKPWSEIKVESVVESSGGESEGTVRKKVTTTITYKLAETYDENTEYYRINGYTLVDDKTREQLLANWLFDAKTRLYVYEYINRYQKTTVYDPNVAYYHFDETEPRYITLDAQQNVTYPLAIGANPSASARPFRVTGDGTVYIADGEFTGTINAKAGTLGNLEVRGTLSGGYISGATIEAISMITEYLEANTRGTIGGWEIGSKALFSGSTRLDAVAGIYTNKFTIVEQATMNGERGELGYIGLVEGSTAPGPGNKTYNIGLMATNQSIILDASGSKSIGNIAMRGNTIFTQSSRFVVMGNGTGWGNRISKIELQTDEVAFNMTAESHKASVKINAPNGIKVTCDATKQEGIYARFA